MLQCVAVGYDVLRCVMKKTRCVAVCCIVFQCVAVCCGVLQCVTMCCGVSRCVMKKDAVCCGVKTEGEEGRDMMEREREVCCSVLRCDAACYGVMQFVAV